MSGKAVDVSRRCDRRVTRTRNTLQRALLSLVQEQEYEAITVDDICRRADVGRSTFYLHFAGKDDLKRSGLEHLRAHLLEVISQPGGRLGFSLPLFKHARDHLGHYRALAGSRGSNISLRVVREIVHDFVRTDLKGNCGTSADQRELSHDLSVQFVTGAFMGLLTWWLDGGARLPPENIDAVFRRLALDGLNASSLPNVDY